MILPEMQYREVLAMTQTDKGVRARTDLDAYFAGFFDGEGNISIRRNPRREWSCYVDLGVTQVSRVPLDLMVKVYGGYVRPKSIATERRQACFCWKCSKGSEVLWALYRMLPWLIVKREKARTALIVLQNRPHLLSGGQISQYQKTAITKALDGQRVIEIAS